MTITEDRLKLNEDVRMTAVSLKGKIKKMYKIYHIDMMDEIVQYLKEV